jgi:hypothetical protein
MRNKTHPNGTTVLELTSLRFEARAAPAISVMDVSEPQACPENVTLSNEATHFETDWEVDSNNHLPCDLLSEEAEEAEFVDNPHDWLAGWRTAYDASLRTEPVQALAI